MLHLQETWAFIRGGWYVKNRLLRSSVLPMLKVGSRGPEIRQHGQTISHLQTSFVSTKNCLCVTESTVAKKENYHLKTTHEEYGFFRELLLKFVQILIIYSTHIQNYSFAFFHMNQSIDWRNAWKYFPWSCLVLLGCAVSVLLLNFAWQFGINMVRQVFIGPGHVDG